MTQGRSIRLFLVDGTSRGLLTVDIVNWTGHVLTGPRSRLGEVVQRPNVLEPARFLAGAGLGCPSIHPTVSVRSTTRL